MFKKSHGAAGVALALIALVVFLGCPTGSGSDPTTPVIPGDDNTGKGGNNTGGTGGNGGNGGKTAAQLAAELVTAWGGTANLKAQGAVVTLQQNLKVENLTGSSSMVLARAAGSGSDPVVIKVASPEIPAGVTLKVPATLTLEVATVTTPLAVKGKIEVAVKGDAASAGTLKVSESATLKVSEAGVVQVAGTLDGTGTITVVERGEVAFTAAGTVGEDATVTVVTESANAKVTVASENANSITDSISVTGPGAIDVSAPAFNRSEHSGIYTLLSYSPATKQVQLKEEEEETAWYDVTGETTLQTLFDAIYTPNAPGSAQDTFVTGESGKTAIAYTAANKADLSDMVLALFSITIDASSSSNDKVELKGTDLPNAGTLSASTSNLVIIDIGKPGVDNTGLPPFSIPNQGLGASNSSYGHIRLRVNNGADLTILADNTGFPTSSCPNGYFNNGCVEVLAGGKLRDGAYQGFPLGSNAVILNRFGSYLSVGPGGEESETENSYWYGYLIGPQGDGGAKPRIKWDGSDPAAFIEVRPGSLAISAAVTVQKTLGLIYSVWFIGNASVTIDIPDDATTTFNSMRGLFANDNGSTKYDFYAATGSTPTITIVDGVLHKAFLVSDSPAEFLSAGEESPLVITGTPSGDDAVKANYPTDPVITGYRNWDIPEPSSST